MQLWRASYPALIGVIMRRSTTAAAGVLFTAALSLTFSGTAQAADRDCPDFPNQAAAQAAFDAVPGDPERLDANNNGEACEDYDYASTGAAAPDAATPDAAATPQVANRPSGAVAAGDGSSATDAGSAMPYVLGGVALTAASGAAFAARRTARTSA